MIGSSPVLPGPIEIKKWPTVLGLIHTDANARMHKQIDSHTGGRTIFSQTLETKPSASIYFKTATHGEYTPL